MHIRFSSLTMCAVAIACAVPLTAGAQRAGTLDTAQSQKMVTDSAAVQSAVNAGNAADVAWNWFIALNNPLAGAAPKMWESWRQTSSVYLPNGQQPAPWGQTPPPPAAVLALAMSEGLDSNLPFHNLDSDLQVDGLALRDKFGHTVRYQLLMNQDTFEYILTNGLYNVNGQQTLAQANMPANFPSTSFELKTSWIWIGTDRNIFSQLNGKYYILKSPPFLFKTQGGKSAYCACPGDRR
jgi:hypothetical protein